MTTAEITAYVMALPVEELRRLTATDLMGWHEKVSHTGNLSWQGPGIAILAHTWRPDIDRNQSRMVTDRILEVCGPGAMYEGMLQVQPSLLSYLTTADDETRAALIAHMIHKEATR